MPNTTITTGVGSHSATAIIREYTIPVISRIVVSVRTLAAKIKDMVSMAIFAQCADHSTALAAIYLQMCGCKGAHGKRVTGMVVVQILFGEYGQWC